jgi:hypothetical protein
MYNGAYGNDTYVIISRGVGLHTTTDLVNWSTDYRDEYLENVIFAEGAFTISGSGGQILRSVNGTDWAVHASGASVPLYGLAYGDGRYVAVGDNGTSATSANGVDWTTSSIGDGNNYWSVTFGEGRFVAVSGAGTIVSSTDGATWAPASLDSAIPGYIELYVVGHGAGRFVAGGYFWDEPTGNEGAMLLSSDDGLTWTLVTDPDIPQDATHPGHNNYWVDEVKYNGSQFVAAGDGGLLLVSTDGLEWSVRDADTTTDFYGAAFGATETVVFGRRGTYSVSSDLQTWVHGNPLPGLGFGRWETINHNGSQYLVGGNASLLATSTDGLQWSARAKPASGTFSDSAYGNGRWVVTSQVNFDGVALITSADGITWELANLPAGVNKCSGVAFGNGMFVASVSDGPSRFIRSNNGVDWSAVDLPNSAVQRGVEFGGGQFVAWAIASTGDPPAPVRIAVSADGENWQVHDTPVTSWSIQAGAYGNDRWNFVGTSGMVLSTTDFGAWQEQQLTFQDRDPVILNGVAFAKGHWVIVGRQHSIWSSADGTTWTEAFTTGMSGSLDRYWDVTSDGESFWACGESGDLIQSEVIPDVSTPRGEARLELSHGASPGSLTLVIEGQAGDDWDLVFSSDLSPGSGETRQSVTLGDVPTVLTEGLDSAGCGFYRLQAPSGTP